MPYRIDLFAVFIFLGIVQGIFLSLFFFSKENRKVKANIFHGCMLLSMTACIIEIFLMYTGYIIDCLYLVDFSEPFALVIGPLFYLMVISLTRGEVKRKQYWHLAFALLYTIAIIPFWMQPDAVKYNSWIEAFNINLPFKEYDYHGRDPRIFLLTDFHTELVLLSLIGYSVLSLIEMIKLFRLKKESFFKPSTPVLKNLSSFTMQVVFITLLIIVVKIFNPRDTGDHIFAAFIALSIYFTSFRVIRESGFFRSSVAVDSQKYKSSSVTGDQQTALLRKLSQTMAEQKPFLQPDFSLPDLARQLGISVHVLSQVINDGLGKNFFEMTAEYRVEEAKRLLKIQRNIKVEEIAEQVGYNSKSSFNTAFKKLTGKTPSEFRAQ
jgi:AraC-like DNA-binding protein